VVQEEVASIGQLAEEMALNVFRMDVSVQVQSAGLRRDATEIGAVFGKEVSSGRLGKVCRRTTRNLIGQHYRATDVRAMGWPMCCSPRLRGRSAVSKLLNGKTS
jgi:hypothetical protein